MCLGRPFFQNLYIKTQSEMVPDLLVMGWLVMVLGVFQGMVQGTALPGMVEHLWQESLEVRVLSQTLGH